MITTPDQYKHTADMIELFTESLEKMRSAKRPANMSERLWQAAMDGIESQLRDLLDEAKEYQQRTSSKP